VLAALGGPTDASTTVGNVGALSVVLWSLDTEDARR